MSSETAATLAGIRRLRATRGLSFSPSFVSSLIGTLDACVVFCTAMAIYTLYVGWSDGDLLFYTTTATINTALTITVFYFAGLYKFDAIKRPLSQWRKILAISVIIFLALIALAFALKVSVEFSRVWAFSSWLVGVSLIFIGRLAAYYFIRKWAESGHLTRNIVVLGAGEQAYRLITALQRNNEPWNSVVGIFDDRASRRHADIPEHEVLGGFDDLVDFVRTHRVDDVVLALPWSAEQRFLEYCSRLREVAVHVRIAPDLVAFHFRKKKISALGGVATFDVVPKPLAGWQYVVKEIEDRVFAVLLTVGLLPLMLGIALAIKLGSPGPVLFRQKRYGYNNKVFSVFKFRTMHHNGHTIAEDDVKQAQRNDPRVTPIGKLLRMTSLDELPQLLNVLGGTMSLVGPRPHAVPHNEQYAKIISDYFARHRCKPGITGWAQVNGLRGETDTPEKMRARVDHDIYYIENWSLLFDIKILLKTVYVVATFKNAY